jgi:predicted alpha/beta hydrolase family esterase
MHYLIVPGYSNSGPEHWQTYWEQSFPDASRVEQRCWEHPHKAEWVDTLDKTVTTLKSDTILVSHSLGVATTVLWLLKAASEKRLPANVKGAFLVAPADIDAIDIVDDFAPMPLEKLPIPTCVVASRNDEYVTFERARLFAVSWGSIFVDVGCCGHINALSNLGAWDEGRKLLAEFEENL